MTPVSGSGGDAFADGQATVPGCVCGHFCEFPCWQREGLTKDPCCAGCPPLPNPEVDVRPWPTAMLGPFLRAMQDPEGKNL